MYIYIFFFRFLRYSKIYMDKKIVEEKTLIGMRAIFVYYLQKIEKKPP